MTTSCTPRIYTDKAKLFEQIWDAINSFCSGEITLEEACASIEITMMLNVLDEVNRRSEQENFTNETKL